MPASSFGQLVAIDVKAGAAGDSQSGLNLLNPRIYGRLADEGCGRSVAFVVIHPSSNFTGITWSGRWRSAASRCSR